MKINYSKENKQKYIELYINGQKERSKKLKSNIIPERLFRYQPAEEKRFETLSDKELFLSNISDFDDPFDTNGLCWNNEIIFKTFKDINPMITEEKTEDFPKFIVKLIKTGILTVCFSEDLYNLPLWGTYANKNSGFVLEYNFKKLGIESRLTKNLFPVLYRPKKFDFTQYLCDSIKEIKNEIKNNQRSSILFYCLLIKHESWSFQQEWRLFNFQKEQKIKDITPTAIYVGLQSTKDTIKRLKDISEKIKCDFYITKLPKNNEAEFIYKYD